MAEHTPQLLLRLCCVLILVIDNKLQCFAADPGDKPPQNLAASNTTEAALQIPWVRTAYLCPRDVWGFSWKDSSLTAGARSRGASSLTCVAAVIGCHPDTCHGFCFKEQVSPGSRREPLMPS